MATATSISLNGHIKPTFAVKKLDHSALDLAKRQLQRNHDETHIFFNDKGFHNHTAHYVLNLWALGADANILEEQFNVDMAMQRPIGIADPAKVASFDDVECFMSNLAKRENYASYLEYFQKQIAARSWQAVVEEFIFKGDPRSNIMFRRLFSSIVHPWIHLALGIEFDQPAIVAEGLAQIAVHEEWLDIYFERVDEVVLSQPPQPKSMIHLLQALHDDPIIKNAPRSTDRPPKRYGILGRALPHMAQYAAQWRVDSSRLPEAVAELTNAAIYTMAAAQMPGKKPKMDFALMHSVTSSIALGTFLQQDWISDANKVRLFEAKGRADLLEYAAAASPTLHLERIKEHPVTRDWDKIANEALHRRQDGHVPKLIRAILYGQQVCAPFESSDHFIIKGDLWLRLANLVVDSVSQGAPFWIFGTGFPEVWEQTANVSYA